MAKRRIESGRGHLYVQRDEAGVTHIEADDWLDALYGLGYVHARDRITQILFSRVVASGQAAAKIADKPELLETDCFFRRVGLHVPIEDEVAALDDAIRAEIQAYCDGVNHGFRTTGRSLPMWATRFDATPWDTRGVLLVGKLLSFGGLAVSQMQNERLLIELIHAGADEQFLRELFAPRLDTLDFDLIREVRMSNQLSEGALDLLSDLPRLAGSNAWAVGPDRTASGYAMLASDPHLEINRLPAIWYEAVMRYGDSYVMGATLPGCPLFAVARSEKISWGVTYMKGDTIDFFIEDCRRGGASGWQYRRGDQWLDFQRREELIGRKGSDAHRQVVYENPQVTLDLDPDARQGPSSDNASRLDEDQRSKAGLYLAFRWTGNGGGGHLAMATWLRIARSVNVAQAMEIARECPQPTLSFVFADAEGHIGLQCCGRFPKRPDPGAGLVPLVAWDQGNHWNGYLSSELLPRIYDPPEGYLATANEIQNPLDGPLLVTQFLPEYRKKRIDQRLAELPRATLDDMQQLQYDLVSLQAQELLQVILPNLPDGELRQRLESWDFRYDADSRDASLFQRLYIAIIVELCGQEHVMGWRRALYLCTRVGYSTMVLTAIDRQLKKHTGAWWEKHDLGRIIRNAASHVRLEDDVPWQSINNFQFINRFYGRGRVGRLLGFESKRIPMPGCHATPFQGHVFQTANREQTFAPSYHFVTDMGEDIAWSNLPGGPSESPFSKYYRSDVDRWMTGVYKPLKPDHAT